MRRRKIVAIVLGGRVAFLALVLAGLLAHPVTRDALLTAAEPRAKGVGTVKSVAELQEIFNRGEETVRIVAWLSPT